MSFAFGARSSTCSYMRPGCPSSSPCTVWQNGVSMVPPSASPSIPVWSWTMSNSSALRNAWIACCISQYVWPIHSLGAVWKTDSRRARVCESPDANSVTSWPASTRPSASRATTRSVPPYASGGTGNHTGQTRPTLIAQDRDLRSQIAIAHGPLKAAASRPRRLGRPSSASYALGNRYTAALDRNGPRVPVGPHALDPEPVEPARELVGHGRDEAL